MPLALVLGAAAPGGAQSRTVTVPLSEPTTFTVTTAGTVPPAGAFLSIRNAGMTPIVNPRVIVNGRDWSTAQAIVDGVVRPGMTDEQKARALWTFARDNRYHWWPPTKGLDARDAVKLFNAYGYGFCSDIADALAGLFKVAGLPARHWILGDNQHDVAEAWYDGAWHMFDADRDGLYLRWDNKTIAGVEELIADPALVARGGPAHADLVEIYRNSSPAQVTSVIPPAAHTLNVTLRPYEELRLSYASSGLYTDDTGFGGGAPPIFANGTLTSVFTPSLPGARALLARTRNLRLSSEDGRSPGLSPTAANLTGDLIYRIESPYPIVGAALSGRFLRQRADDLIEVSTARNGGRLHLPWTPLANGQFEVDGYDTVASGLSTFSQDGNYPALHTAGGPASLTYRMRPWPDAQGRIIVKGSFYRNDETDEVSVRVSQDGVTWQTVWTATETGYFDQSIDIAPIVASWSSFYLRFAFTPTTAFWATGAEEIVVEGVDPFTYRTAWSAGASDPTGAFDRTVDLTPTTTWFGSSPLYAYLVRVRLRSSANHLGVGLDQFRLTTTVQVSPRSLPALKLGANEFRYEDDTTTARQVVISQGWTERTEGAAPGAPTAAIYPAHNAHIVTTDALSLVWRAAAHAAGDPIYRYQVWVCDSALCTAPMTAAFDLAIHNTDVGPDGVFGTSDDGAPKTPLPRLTAPVGDLLVHGQRYYWRVRAQAWDGTYSPWSQIWSFVVDEASVDPTAAPQIAIVTPGEEETFATGAARVRLSGVAASPSGVASVRWWTGDGGHGVAVGTTAWSTGEIALPMGESLVTVQVTDALGRVGVDMLAVTRGEAQTGYILPEGATGDFFDLDVAVANPNDAPVTASARFLLEGGSTITLPLTVDAFSRQRIRVDDVPGVGTAAVSTVVSTTDGLPLVVERTSSWDASGYGGHGARALEATSTQWFFAEGAQGFFDTYVLLTNTSGAAADVTVSFFLEGGGRIERTYEVPNAARVTVYTGGIPELVDHSFAFEISATRPIAAERATYFGGARAWDGGHSSTGATEPATTWFHAEGATGPFFETFILIGNPGTTPARVRVTYLTSGGARTEREHDVPAQSRVTLNVETQDPALESEAVATIVTSDAPIVSERVTYWGHGAWTEGSTSLGATAAALRWGVADGRLGGPRDYQTYLLIANPDATRDAAVTVRFLTTAGESMARSYVVPAGRRWNVQVGADVPELAGREFGARIESTNGVPIFAARAMYWNANGEVWAAGVSVPATPLP